MLVCVACFQEVYQQTHPVLFSDRAIYVILYSLRTEVNMVDLHRHLMNVTIRCKEAPIILVGTHSDCIGGNPSLPLPALKARYPQVHDTHLVQMTLESPSVFVTWLAFTLTSDHQYH